MNAQIYQFLSDVMSRMGEAITNIRTVRACSSEEYESQRNEDGLRKALVAGIKDAFANGLTAALNDYLDLLAGVLILWYGGSIAMNPNGAISTGQLITYQVHASRPSHRSHRRDDERTSCSPLHSRLSARSSAAPDDAPLLCACRLRSCTGT